MTPPSRSQPTPSEMDELLGVYALDAVDPSEREAVDAYLRDNPRARAEVRDFQEVAGLLAHAGAVAPEGVWGRIEAEIGGTGAEHEPPPFLGLSARTLGSSATTQPASATAEKSDDDRSLADVIDLQQERLARWSHTKNGRRFTIAATSVAAAAIAVLGFQVHRQNDKLNKIESRFLLLPSGDSTPSMKLRGPSGAAVELLLDADQAYWFEDTLTPLPLGQTYQLWALRDDHPAVSLGVLGREPNPRASFPIERVDELLVTIEEAGGAVSPSSNEVVRSRVPR